VQIIKTIVFFIIIFSVIGSEKKESKRRKQVDISARVGL
jgi:hypothetical protein